MSDTASAPVANGARRIEAVGDGLHAQDAETHDLETRVAAEQARLMLERTRASTWAGLPAGLLIVWLLLPYFSAAALAAWFAAKMAVLMLRLWIDAQARRDGRHLVWSRHFELALAADGVLFGMLGWALLPRGAAVLGPVMVATLVAIASIGTVVLSVHRRACLAFVLPILLPVMLLQLAEGSRIALFLGIGVAIYLGLLVLEVGKSDRHTRAMLRLRFQTDRLSAEREAALGRALHSDAAKGQFLATISHEMRTPLHGILGLAQELQRAGRDGAGDAADAAERQQHLQTIARTGDHLLGIINDVLDYSKIESGHLRLSPQDFELQPLLASLVALNHVAAAERGLTLTLDAALPEPCRLRGDAVRLRQVLLNLIGNALKFTEAGGVTLHARAAERGAALALQIDVTDSGPGVPAAERERIFDPFHQLDGSWSRRKGGTGLGLAISRELAAAMGGQLVCIDPAGGGRGACFRLTVDLPRAATPAAAVPAAGAGGAAPLTSTPGDPRLPPACRVLLAEDNEVNAIVARAMLERAGLQVSHAHDGLEAVAMAQAQGPDLILMDCQMPGIDGFEATRRIRHEEAASGRTPVAIVALTANALDGDRERCLAAGMDDHLGKPFDEAALLALVARHARRTAGWHERAGPRERPAGAARGEPPRRRSSAHARRAVRPCGAGLRCSCAKRCDNPGHHHPSDTRADLAADGRADTATERGITLLLDHDRRANDDPRAALQELDRRLAGNPPADERFWLLLAKARAHTWLEEPAEQQASADLAAALLRGQGAPGPLLERQRLWLRLEQANVAINLEAPAQVLARVAALRDDARRAGDATLDCVALSLEMWLLVEASNLDDAWLAAESLERCAKAMPIAPLQVVAYAAMGQIASEARFDPSLGRDAAAFFERALAALGKEPARWRRSLIEWDYGNSMRRAKKHEAALDRLGRALELSRQLGDRAGVAAANSGIARIHVEEGRWRHAIALLDGAIALLQGHDTGTRLAYAHELKIKALARLDQPAVLAVIEAARAWDRPELQPSARAGLALAMAEGYASQRAWPRAYAEMQRAHQLEKDGRDLARDSQVLRLQARYDATRREAENAALRHSAELARIALEREGEIRQRLVMTAALLALLAAIGIGFASRLWLRRRAYAALALRDELTGSANRRAVNFYAQAQFDQARALQVPMTLALIDLDHFKQVNDRHGHPAGDALLKAFVQAVQPVLRGQDRLGRWGGEEWLLVLPGTRVDELPRLFERLREGFARAAVPGMPAPHGVRFSMGGAAVSGESASLAEVVAEADRRLYRAKDEGRDRVRWSG